MTNYGQPVRETMIVNRSTTPNVVAEQADRRGPVMPNDLPRAPKPRFAGQLQTKAEAQQAMEAKAAAKSHAPARAPVPMNVGNEPIEGIGRGAPPPGTVKVR